MSDPGVFFGFYRGKVVNNDDSDQPYPYRACIKVEVPQVYGWDLPEEELPWAEPCIPAFGGSKVEVGSGEGRRRVSHGLIAIPPIGATVWVGFEQGDPQRPIWFGTWMGMKDNIMEMSPAAYSDSRFGATYPNIGILQAPWNPISYTGSKTSGVGNYIRFVGQNRIEIVYQEGRNYIEIDGSDRKITIKSTGYDIDINAAAADIGDEKTIDVRGGNIAITANRAAISQEKIDAGLSIPAGAELEGDITINGNNITITALNRLRLVCPEAIEVISYYVDEDKRKHGSIKLVADTMHGSSNHCSGFERH